MITGYWKGKIKGQRVEVKIIQNGDSLAGTSYYIESANNYRRYSIRGYFDPETNSAVWWDDQLLDERSGRFSISTPGKIPLLSRADFNCPGGGRMMLDGKSSATDNELKPLGEVHLNKTDNTQFEDEWDYVIDNYTVGTNDPEIIDSIAALSFRPVEKPAPVITETVPVEEPVIVNKEPEIKPRPVVTETVIKEEPKIITPVKQQTIEEKFKTREKILTKEIPVLGDSIELRFYDNAEIDGDSISLFLNNRLLLEHVRLTGNAYTIKLSVADLQESNELIMVAENLGAIPPNTSYMVAIIAEKRYDAYLASSEGSSAMIRLLKK